jgi:hypothetical protein
MIRRGELTGLDNVDLALARKLQGGGAHEGVHSRTGGRGQGCAANEYRGGESGLIGIAPAEEAEKFDSREDADLKHYFGCTADAGWDFRVVDEGSYLHLALAEKDREREFPRPQSGAGDASLVVTDDERSRAGQPLSNRGAGGKLHSGN